MGPDKGWLHVQRVRLPAHLVRAQYAVGSGSGAAAGTGDVVHPTGAAAATSTATLLPSYTGSEAAAALATGAGSMYVFHQQQLESEAFRMLYGCFCTATRWTTTARRRRPSHD